MTTAKRRPERFALRVRKGGFDVADTLTSSRLRARNYRNGDLVFVEIRKPRNPKFHRMAHALGSLCAENIDEFHGADSHRVLKRLQIESGIGCDEVAIKAPGLGMLMHRVPRSLSFESMDDGEFHAVMLGLCRHIAKVYWPSLTGEQIEEMAGVMVQEAA
jgi:hypothetical protein